MDVERTMEFSLERQAQLAREFEKVNAALMKSAERHTAIEEQTDAHCGESTDVSGSVVEHRELRAT
jgi:prefoldin subunit 5